MYSAKCPKCGGAMHSTGAFTTLVGYLSPAGHDHDHDDNCRKREYRCACGHVEVVSRRNRCPVCDWAGKSDCWCCPNGKVDEWPEDVAEKEIG